MRQSTCMCRTLREPPAEVDLPGLQLAVRAGLLRVTGAGLHAWLPLGQRTLARLGHLARTAVESLGAQAMSLPALYLAETPAPDNFVVQDRLGRRYALDDGSPAALLRVIQNDLVSYRQLPAMVYRIAAQFHDEERPRGLLRGRERTTLSLTSLHASQADLEGAYPGLTETLSGVLRQCGLEAWSVPTQTGHQFLLPHPLGDQVLFTCRACNYRAISDEASFVKSTPPSPPPDVTLRKIATPDCHTIAKLAAFLNVPATQTLKAMMYADDDNRVVFAVIRGDLDLNAAKLERAVRHTRLPLGRLQPATDEQLRAVGAVPGYASPVGLSGVIVLADDSVQSAAGMVAGANEEGYHLSGVTIPRDFAPTVVADIAQARAGDACPECRGTLEASNVIELGGCERIGIKLSEALDITFRDAAGKACPLALGSCALDLSRIIAAVLETHHDEHGLIWPAMLAPFDAHLIVLGKEPREQAELLYEQLQQAGLDVLYDDRDESPGIKFADADLIGLPIRLTVSKRSLDKGGVEVKARASTETRIVALEGVASIINPSLS
jgi:prolyl-tRNA synthetase